jgi:hypothetical protein
MDLWCNSPCDQIMQKSTKIAAFRHFLRAVLVNSARKFGRESYQRTLKILALMLGSADSFRAKVSNKETALYHKKVVVLCYGSVSQRSVSPAL